MAEQFDVIIIGSGQGGNPLARAFANSGKRTALIEKSHVGGSCVNYGCTPTKTMLASARVAHLVQRAGDYGVQVSGGFDIDMTRIRQRKRDMVEQFRSGLQERLENTENLTLIYGEASFTASNGDQHQVHIDLKGGDSRDISSPLVIINTGQIAITPPIDGLQDVPFHHEAGIMELDEVPEHLAIIGGGYIGLEFGQMFRRLGSEVTIIDHAERLVEREDPDISEEILKMMCQDGIQVLLGAKVTRVTQSDGQIHLTYNLSGDESESSTEKTLTASHLLVGVGRKPNTEALNLKAVGLETGEKGEIPVDDRLQTGVKGIYAIGDVKGGPAFTHISYDDYRILAENLIHGGNASISGRIVAYTMFIDPQLGRVGMTENEASEKGYNIQVGTLAMKHVARALETDETRGFMKAVIDADTKQILGAAILGIEGGEVMSLIQVAMLGKLPYTALRDCAFAHPLLSESLNNLFATIR